MCAQAEIHTNTFGHITLIYAAAALRRAIFEPCSAPSHALIQLNKSKSSREQTGAVLLCAPKIGQNRAIVMESEDIRCKKALAI